MAQEYSEGQLAKLHSLELEILDAIAAICESHNIAWFLDSGTALGAVRHKGFIPWDDDIDIGMLRDDYNRFLEIAPTSLPEQFVLHKPGEPGMAGMFAKVCKLGMKFWTQETIDANFDQGVFVDIFPYDVVFENISKRKRQYRQARKLTRLSYLYHSGNISVPGNGVLGKIESTLCRIAHPLVKSLFSRETIFERFRSTEQMAANEASNLYAPLAYPYFEPIKLEDILPPNYVTFQGRTYPTFHNTSKYLVSLYGETWNQLPPKDQRKTHAPLVLEFGDSIENYHCERD
jgi:lipopolysaccharide cholinephosphotransferase